MPEWKPTCFRIFRPGLLTTIQDLGRFGYQRFGISVAGAMDPWALICGNRLVGNPDAAAALEVTVIGPELVFEHRAIVAQTGGDFPVWLDGNQLPNWCATEVPAQSTLRIGERRSGARGYLAVAGGLDVPLVLGSRSTHLRSGLGGLGGVPLRKGDVVNGGPVPCDAPARIGLSIPPELRPPYSADPTLRVLPGPQSDAFLPKAFEALTQGRYLISPDADRMGYRLHGPPLPHHGDEILSDATPLGALQVPASHQPILLMADRQTTGGYPKMAVVISADIPLAAQLVPGDTVGFQAIGLEEARRIVRGVRDRLDAVLPPCRV
jgi:antagonist of KipI